MKYLICKQFRFEAAHWLPMHPGRCRSEHGHSYKLEVFIGCRELDAGGMVMDFEELSKIVQELILDKFDHGILNNSTMPNPTAENIAAYIFGVLSRPLGKRLEKIRLWETVNCYAEVAV